MVERDSRPRIQHVHGAQKGSRYDEVGNGVAEVYAVTT